MTVIDLAGVKAIGKVQKRLTIVPAASDNGVRRANHVIAAMRRYAFLARNVSAEVWRRRTPPWIDDRGIITIIVIQRRSAPVADRVRSRIGFEIIEEIGRGLIDSQRGPEA